MCGKTAPVVYTFIGWSGLLLYGDLKFILFKLFNVHEEVYNAISN